MWKGTIYPTSLARHAGSPTRRHPVGARVCVMPAPLRYIRLNRHQVRTGVCARIARTIVDQSAKNTSLFLVQVRLSALFPSRPLWGGGGRPPPPPTTTGYTSAPAIRYLQPPLSRPFRRPGGRQVRARRRVSLKELRKTSSRDDPRPRSPSPSPRLSYTLASTQIYPQSTQLTLFIWVDQIRLNSKSIV